MALWRENNILEFFGVRHANWGWTKYGINGINFQGFKRIGFWGLIWERGVAFIDALLEHLGIVVKLPWWKFGSISPYFRGGNQATFRVKCLIAHKTLFSPSFCCENKNTAKRMPHFHSDNLAQFRIWCAMVHWQGFIPMYTTCVNVFILRQAGAHWSIKTLMHVAYTRKPMSLADMYRGNQTVTVMHTM